MSFVIQSGMEVVADEKGKYMRNAVTLIDGEFCLLLAPDGKRSYCRGPAVVFPKPMDEFVQKDNRRVFKAYPLRKNTGLHIRVVKDFAAVEGDQVSAGSYRAGQELFLKDQEGFFFPTEDLEVLGEVRAIPIAEKEGIYVRNVETGSIVTEVGPKNYLPDPTREEVVQRVLDVETSRRYGLSGGVDKSKAVSIYIPPSFAVLVTAKNKREVFVGPQTRILGYSDDLEVLKLSTGTPKSDASPLSTCFLQVGGNKVSDVVLVKTGDHVEIEVALSYRVSFVANDDADREKWFNVKNYVSLMCDHLSSIIRAAVRNTSIEAFHANSTEIIRTAVLGEKRGEEKRAGRTFSENGMMIYDVEVLEALNYETPFFVTNYDNIQTAPY